MVRYARLWLKFLKMSWMADMEYRLNVITRVTGEVIWYVAQLSVFEVLYTHSDSISGWDVHAMRVFMGTLFLVDALYMILFHDNMDHFFSLVRRGDLDLYLTKPVNSQFMVSCRKVLSTNFINLAMVLTYLSWAIPRLTQPVSPGWIVAYALMILCGLAILYALRFIFATVCVVLQDLGSIQFVWYQFYRLGTRPDVVYPGPLRLVIMTVFPVAFFASVPSRMLIEGPSPGLMAAAVTFAVLLVALSNRWWRWALRHYASASS